MPLLEFTLDPADIPRLARWPGIRPSRSFPCEITWLDTPTLDLAARHLSLEHRAGLWSLSPLRAAISARPPTPLAEARHPSLLGHDVPDDIVPGARLVARRQSLRWTGPAGETIEIRLLAGRISLGPNLCRLTLDGPAAALPQLATALAAQLSLHVPRATLAEQALSASRSQPLPSRALGAPDLSADLPVTASLAAIIGHLLDAMLLWADLVPAARTPEPVHQMRVAIRRLRSALSVYKGVAACPGLAALDGPLRACAAHLGAARDWDVFLEDTGPRLAETLADTLPGDRRCAAMLRAAARRRRQTYTDLRIYLAAPEFRTLVIALACAAVLRPWDDAAPPSSLHPSPLQQPTSVFASALLTRRLRHVRKAGRGLDALSLPALHALRKDCKRLRYTAEFFRPLLPATHAKRFLARLSDLQDELGRLNDTASITGLMSQLGRPHTFAAGLAEGFSAARSRPARARIARRWKTFKQAKPFWP